MFKLQCPPAMLPVYAGRYQYDGDDDLDTIAGTFMRDHGYLTRDRFLRLCRWKSPRTQPRCAKNSADFVEAVTRTALSSDNERLRIEVLTLLKGVAWPTASVILHFGHRDRYPILDYRALWSLGIHTPPAYNFDIWMAYTESCRSLADEHGMTMRDLDRALWQYSKENQKKSDEISECC